jgi:hypothetical protein
MADLSGFPYFEVEFDKSGEMARAKGIEQLGALMGAGKVTDLLVISHGWNNDMAEARALYDHFFARTREVLDTLPALQARKFAVLGVLWPSKKFADEDLIASGAAGLHARVDGAAIKTQLDGLKGFFDDAKADAALTKARALVDSLEDKATARREFVDLLRSLLPPPNSQDKESPQEFFQLAGDDLIDRLGKPLAARGAARVHAGGAAGGVAGGAAPGAGGAAGLGELFGGLLAGARNLLNYTTYYQMKERAGTVGRDGLNPQLRTLHKQFPQVKIHLIGHSFGGRLVTASAAGSGAQSSFGPASLTLLQAAFSHLGFAQDYDGKKSDGLFRRVMADRMVSGPVLVTCTGNDKAVGVMYAIASRLKNQVASGLGDKNDIYGGIGRNGAQTTPEASDATLLGVGGHYQFEGGKLYNLNADAVVSNHSDICKNEVAYALLSAVSAA